MKSYLVLQLYGPFAAFGDTAVGEYRPSYDHPSKSGIVGLLCAAMGISRTDEKRIQDLSAGLGFSVLVLESGKLLRDYHTAQVASEPKLKKRVVATRKDELDVDRVETILSSRDYRMDSLYRIAIWSNSSAVQLDQIENALLRPGFIPYLGRKSCPVAVPFVPQLVDAVSAREALLSVRDDSEIMELLFSVLKINDKKREGSFRLYQDHEEGIKEGMKVSRRDRLINRKNWQFGNREEIMISLGGADVLQQNTDQ